jgi:hypothetical protein
MRIQTSLNMRERWRARPSQKIVTTVEPAGSPRAIATDPTTSVRSSCRRRFPRVRAARAPSRSLARRSRESRSTGAPSKLAVKRLIPMPSRVVLEGGQCQAAPIDQLSQREPAATIVHAGARPSRRTTKDDFSHFPGKGFLTAQRRVLWLLGPAAPHQRYGGGKWAEALGNRRAGFT